MPHPCSNCIIGYGPVLFRLWSAYGLVIVRLSFGYAYGLVMVRLWSGYDPVLWSGYHLVIVRLSFGYHLVMVQLMFSSHPVIVQLSSGYHLLLISLRYSMPAFSANSFGLFFRYRLTSPACVAQCLKKINEM